MSNQRMPPGHMLLYRDLSYNIYTGGDTMSYAAGCGTPGYGSSVGVVLVLYVLLVIILATFY
jgi:hypothetical protein